MIAVNPKPYRGRFHSKAVELVKSGVRVGKILAGSEESGVCHVCKSKVPYPDTIHKDGDAWVECPGCKLPFVIVSAFK